MDERIVKNAIARLEQAGDSLAKGNMRSGVNALGEAFLILHGNVLLAESVETRFIDWCFFNLNRWLQPLVSKSDGWLEINSEPVKQFVVDTSAFVSSLVSALPRSDFNELVKVIANYVFGYDTFSRAIVDVSE